MRSRKEDNIPNNNFEYLSFKYPLHIRHLLDNTELKDSDFVSIEKVHADKSKVYFPIVKDLYILSRINKLTTKQLSYIYGVGMRSIQIWLKELGLNKTIKQAKRKNTYSDALVFSESGREYWNKIENNETRKKTNKGSFEYYNFHYKEKELTLIKSITFNEEQTKAIGEINKVWGNSKYKPIIEDLYKFWISEYSPADIGVVYGKSNRLFQNFFSRCGLERDKWEAQRLAGKKRDYKQIRLKGKQTMIKNNTLIEGSSYEQYTRNLLNCTLPMRFPGLEIIVGLNNISILNEGLEIDIPIIIINGEKIVKIAIEYDGYFWHKDNGERDDYKEMKIMEKSYELFRIEPKEQATEKQVKEEIALTIQDIEKYIEYKMK